MSPDALTIREAELSDAEGVMRMMREIEGERLYRIFEEGEQVGRVHDQEEQVRWFGRAENRRFVLAFCEGELAGYAMLMGGEYAVDRCTGTVVLEVRKRCQRRGVGRALIGRLEESAREAGMRRLELTVLSFNDAAIALYEAAGFQKEGARRESRRIEGRFCDEWWMAKLL